VYACLMPSVLLAGDLHGNVNALQRAFRQAHYNEAIAVVQLGDYGFGWHTDGDQCWFATITADMAAETGIPFYFIDGNHENFDLLEKYPVDENGLREVAPNVWHITRGATITFGQTKFLALGGAYSVDKPNRAVGKSWWPQEAITIEDVERAIAAGPADVLLTHDIPDGIQDHHALKLHLNRMFGEGAAENSIENQKLISIVLKACGAQRAFHGHLHAFHETDLDGITIVGLDKEVEAEAIVLLEV